MAGIYLHIPFCRQACTYCNFHFTTSLRNKTEMVSALVEEIRREKNYLAGQPVDTVYFGGGTPSLLDKDEVERLISAIKDHFDLTESAEITLEANPDDINRQKLRDWRAAGINRLSIGVQSFFEAELKWMNRAHNEQQARQCIEWSQQEGFHNLSIDLIYGSPLLSDDRWQHNVETAVGYGVPHLSCYALTVEEKTPLYKNISRQRTMDVDPDKQARQFLWLMQWAKEKGYEHYEVSNFAKPGMRSRHNSSYWKGEKYLGIGPSAHSYDGAERRWNVANNNVYTEGSKNAIYKRETELLTPKQKMNEYIMISLRTMEGLDLKRMAAEWGDAERDRIAEQMKRFIERGWIVQHSSFFQLTDDGMLMADGIASELFC